MPLTALAGGDLDEPLTAIGGGDETVRVGLGSAETAKTRFTRLRSRSFFVENRGWDGDEQRRRGLIPQ